MNVPISSRPLQGLPACHSSAQAQIVLQKYWWALTLLEMDYTILFMDNDAAIVRDPFQHYDPSYDIQGLSDWNYMAELPSPQVFALAAVSAFLITHHA